MRKQYSIPANWSKAILSILMLLMFASDSNLMAQAATYIQEAFNASIPYTTAANANHRVTTTDWFQAKIAGTAGAPNDFQWVNAGANPVAANQNITGFTAGAGFVRYVNRTTVYGTGTAGVNYAANSDSAYISSRALDFSGHFTNNNSNGAGAPDTVGISVWRDNTGGAVSTVPDAIQVFINTQPSLTGATLMSITYINGVAAAGGNIINRSSALAPLTGVVGGAWNRYAFQIPNLATYVGVTGGTSSAYILVAGYSAGGNNIFIDNFNYPEWPTAMTITNTQLVFQENADVGKSSTNNLLLGIQVTTKGSSSAKRADGISFSINASSNWPLDVTNPLAYYTGGTNNFAINNGAVTMPSVAAVANSGGINFGYSCGTAPASMTLNPGNENYFWFAVDITGAAQTLDYVGAEFQFISALSGLCTYYGGVVTSTNLLTTPIPAQTQGFARQIDQAYTIPTYTNGTSWNGGSYSQNDYVSVVNLPGDNGTLIDNYYHDAWCAACAAASNALCDRFACHPPDYTQFKPVAFGPAPYSINKQRFAQVTVAKGVRTTTPAYTLKAQCGTWFGSNCIGVFIDWNKDGDFSDSYCPAGSPGCTSPNLIKEDYGTQCQTASTMMIPNFWGANTSWIINVPDVTDIVTNVGGTGGPIFLGNVRLRVREIYNATGTNMSNGGVHPTNSGYTWGEVEDYTIQVLPNCPTLASNVCKWIGNSSDWSNLTNWCPKVPTINDIAYIPPVTAPFVNPTIKENTAAVCRTLSLQNGANLNIDAYTGSSFNVYDDVVIGSNIAGSNSSIAVNSTLSKTQTIPSASFAPPLGIALAPQTPFKTNAHCRTQIAYTAAELGTTFGWRAGDVIDQISIEVAQITTAPAGSATYPNFQILYYLVNTPINFASAGFPAPANTSIAVATTTPPANYGGGAITAGPIQVYSNVSQILNMPTQTGGTKANGNYYTFNLSAPYIVWDGVSSLVLELSYKTTIGGGPAKNYVLYNEGSPSFSVLNITYNAAGSTITGWVIDGQTHYAGGPASTAGITATISAQRPRLDFHRYRPYSVFPLTVKGNWYNNNKLRRTGVYGGLTPVYNIDGDSGFIGGMSKVIFDPTGRNTVNSPGLAAANPSYYTGIPGATLTADLDQDISSQINSGAVTAYTVFNNLEIAKASATGKAVRQNSTLAATFGAYADTLRLTTGELYLNHKEFTLMGTSPATLVQSGFSWLRSEDNIGVTPGTMDSKFTWKIGAGTSGTFAIPFKRTAAGSVFNFKYNKITVADDVGNLTVATYGTASWDNTPYPYPPLPIGNPLHVVNMTTNPTPVLDATPWTVDRFWLLKRSTSTVLSGAPNMLTFEYDNSVEGTSFGLGSAAYVPGEMVAQRYEISGANPGWHAPYPGQGDGNAGGNIRFVNHPSQYLDQSYSIWTIVHTNLLQQPLPLTLVKFDAKEMGSKVKLWWDVQSETGVSNYTVERTVDFKLYDDVAFKTPVGPSTELLHYEAWDNQPLKGTQYYRLATSTVDGATDFSKPVRVDIGIKGLFDITNVSTGNDATSIKVDFVYDSALPYSYIVTDLVGNIVAKGDNNKATQGENSIVIPLQLARGLYIISLVNNEKTVTRKLNY